MKQCVLSLLVSNHFGVLTRVTNLFSRRGFNIKSLTVGETENPALSRMTILTEGDDNRKSDQIKKQLNKLEDVKKSMEIPEDLLICRELLLIKVRCPQDRAEELSALLSDFGAKKLAEQSESAIVEMTGPSATIDKFIKRSAEEFGVMEVCRTGEAALENSNQTIY